MNQTHTEISQPSPRRGPSNLLMAKNRAVFLSDHGLVFTALPGGKQTKLDVADVHAFGLVGDDVVLGIRSQQGKESLLRLAPGDTHGHRLPSLTVPIGLGMVFPTARPDEIYVSDPPAEVYRYRIEASRVVPIDTVDLAADQADTVTEVSGGRVAFVANDAIVRLGPKDTRESFHFAFAAPRRIAAGPAPDTLWMTDDHHVSLARLANGKVKVEHTIDIATADRSVVFDLASAGDFVAVVAQDLVASRITSRLVVLGADGSERWQVSLSDYPSFVAANPTYVAVQQEDALHVWKAADGTTLLPR